MPWKRRIGRRGHLVVVAILHVARRIESDVRRKGDRGRIVQLAEPLIARIDGRDRAFGEPHHGDARGIDPRMGSEQRQRPVGVDHHCERIELRLVADRADDAASGKCIENESCDAERIYLFGPGIYVAADAAGAVDENDRG
jgi:hypothetical protein